MRWSRRRAGPSVWVQALLGAASGLAASWVMERAQRPIMGVGSEATKRREQAAQGDQPPATVRAARRAAHLAGTAIAEERVGSAAETVHYATGALFGAAFGVLAPRVALPALAAGALWGAVVWLVNDEGLVPALGLSGKPWAYPASTHAKALASHLVYGAATDVGYRLLGRAVH